MAHDDAPEERRADKPMFGERRPQTPALLGVLALVVVVVLVFLLLTYL